MPEAASKGADGRFVLGLVGRAGSGKSTVARTLAEDGATVIEADRIGHDVTDYDPDVREALVHSYGADVYLGDGTLDRARVAARVFADREALAALNALVHPRIAARIRERIAAAADGVVVVDAALMLDWGLDRDCDAVLAVVAPEREQIARLVAGRNWSETQARDRLNAQRTNEAFAAAADAVIENTGSREELARAARETLARLRARRVRGA
jgi:dephospho-CoA kinase